MAGRRRSEGDELDELAGIVPDPEPYRIPPREQFAPVPMPFGKESYNVGPVDIRGWQDFATIITWQVQAFRWGQVVVTVDGNRGSDNRAIFAEVRIIGYVGAAAFILLEDAAGHQTDRPEEVSPGPLRLVIYEGEMPDRLEIQARHRREGVAEGTAGNDQFLSATVNGRFGA